MKLPNEASLPQTDDVKSLKRRVTELWRLLAVQVNGLSEGSITARYQAQATAPSTGTYQQGDFVPNLTPTEFGTVGAKYVVTGFICITGGAPGTWRACRALTGN